MQYFSYSNVLIIYLLDSSLCDKVTMLGPKLTSIDSTDEKKNKQANKNKKTSKTKTIKTKWIVIHDEIGINLDCFSKG